MVLNSLLGGSLLYWFAVLGSLLDFSTAEQTSIAAEGIVFDESVSIGDYSSGCALRDDGSPEVRMAVGPFSQVGLGWNFVQNEEWQTSANANCTIHNSISIDFTGTNSKMAGLFNVTRTYSGSTCVASDYADENIGNHVFPVTFTPN